MMRAERSSWSRGRQCYGMRRSVFGFLLLRGPLGDVAIEPLPLAVSSSLISFFDSSPSKHHRSWSICRGVWVSSSRSLESPWLFHLEQGRRASGLCSPGWRPAVGMVEPGGASFCCGEPIAYLASFLLLLDMAALTPVLQTAGENTVFVGWTFCLLQVSLNRRWQSSVIQPQSSQKKMLRSTPPWTAALPSFEGAIHTPCAQDSALFTLILGGIPHWHYHQDLGHSVCIILFTKTDDVSGNRKMTSCLSLVFQLYFSYTMWKGFVDACSSDILSPDVLFTLSFLFAWCWAKSKELHSFALHSHFSGCTKLQILH